MPLYYKGKGCLACNGSGYKGRIALFELIEIGPDIKERIVARSSSEEIWSLAQSHGAVSLFEDGLDKVKNGLTTLEEVFRVASPVKSG